MTAGLGFQQARGWFQFRSSWVRIPAAKESSHVLIMGDTGAGKSVLVRQILLQIQARGEPAIVYDPTGEFVERFYQPERGDVIMNPLDERCPYWTPADEIRIDAEALTLAQSLYPVKPQENSFFAEAPQRIMAALMIRRLNPEAIVRILSSVATHTVRDGQTHRTPSELDVLLAGTPYAEMISHEAGPQRAGVLASLNLVADAFLLTPSEHATTRRWSATAWSEHRHGWVFFTSTPETRERLRPLTSLWLDFLVLRLMNQAQTPLGPDSGHGQRAWFVIDELASLQKLPQLHTAMTEARKSRCPLVLAFQGRSQMSERYQLAAEVMLSQPATKVFLRTSEPESAEWISKSLGTMEIERLKFGKSASDGWATTNRHGLNWALERQVEPLALPSEIQGLRDLSGYLKFGNMVTKMALAYVDPQRKHTRYLPRPDVATAGTPPALRQQPASTQTPALVHRWS